MYNMEHKQIVQNFNALAADFSSLDDFIQHFVLIRKWKSLMEEEKPG